MTYKQAPDQVPLCSMSEDMHALGVTLTMTEYKDCLVRETRSTETGLLVQREVRPFNVPAERVGPTHVQILPTFDDGEDVVSVEEREANQYSVYLGTHGEFQILTDFPVRTMPPLLAKGRALALDDCKHCVAELMAAFGLELDDPYGLMRQVREISWSEKVFYSRKRRSVLDDPYGLMED